MSSGILQGKPFRHPVHTFLIHFPIGLLLLSLVMDLASWVAGPSPALVRGSCYAMVGGILTALLAALPGFVDRAQIRTDHPARRIVNYHMALNLAAVGLYVVNFLLRRQAAADEPRTPALPLALSLAGIGILAVSGYLGGTLVYDQGIAVGRHRRATGLPVETVRAGTATTQDGWAPVAQATLQDGETLRVDVNGTVMTVARLDGQYYAFQEFCTHRFGPLSEGSFRDGQVMCPWHRSCFDVRTGQVTHGPAQVGLKTFPVQVRDGRICVRGEEAARPAASQAEAPGREV
jgi:nitrite reductase/ring-hydroxylating ferredoxin subunit/uncharacterized membrane protein